MGSRRAFLATLGAAAGLAGCQRTTGESEETEPVVTARPGATATTERPSGTAIPYTDRFDTVYDVTEEGVDPTGSEPATNRLEQLVGDDTLLYFPSGTYLLHNLFVEDVTNLGLVGRDATLELATKGRSVYLGLRHVADVLVEGFSLDNTATNVAAWCDLKCTGGTNVVRDYTVEGFVDVDERTNGFTIMVEGGDTSLDLENVDLSQGAVNGAATFVFPRIEFYNPDRQPGSLTFRNCTMKGWGKEGLYASAHSGPLRVIGGEYAHNAIAQVRVGGGNAPGQAVVRDVTVRADSIPDYMPDGNRILRGIWLKEGDGALVEGCDVELSNLGIDHTQAGILVNYQFGRATIRDCHVTVDDVSRPAIHVEEPADEFRPNRMRALEHLPEAWDVTIEDVTVDGHSPNSEGIRVDGRGECTLRNVRIDATGQASDGLTLDHVGRCTYESGTVTTDRFPIVVQFQGENDCVLDLADVGLEGTGLHELGSAITNEGNGRYCIGPDVLSGTESRNTDHFTLTKSEPSAGSADVSDSTRRYRLYGRWLTL